MNPKRLKVTYSATKSSFMCDEATLAWKLNACERTGCTVGMEGHNSLSKVTRSFDHGGLQLVRSEHPSFSLPQQTCFLGFGAWDARASFYQLLLKRFQVLRDPQHCLQGVCQHRSESIAQWSAASSWHLSCGNFHSPTDTNVSIVGSHVWVHGLQLPRAGQATHTPAYFRWTRTLAIVGKHVLQLCTPRHSYIY